MPRLPLSFAFDFLLLLVGPLAFSLSNASPNNITCLMDVRPNPSTSDSWYTQEIVSQVAAKQMKLSRGGKLLKGDGLRVVRMISAASESVNFKSNELVVTVTSHELFSAIGRLAPSELFFAVYLYVVATLYFDLVLLRKEDQQFRLVV
ncbi:hypothetical protein BT96DRAFT_973323 [Gymnopus androsaceus JB14]|uniref:Uncharacterized protein n=1 Tax=Gymnopus androsaceus JB14 TaxID=1447944 RepID=A0A6A4HXL9_9AGAR|nr:hypothetical protein BT96DRAFT_973323 [Gymnopus androsaceus JB14]